MEKMGLPEMRARIGEYLAQKIGVSANEDDSKKFGAAVRLFVEEKLSLPITNEGSHKAYGGYSDRSAHKALEKIFEGMPAFKAGAKHENLCRFEESLIQYIAKEKIFQSYNIPPYIFRENKSGQANELLASKRLLRKAETQAEYLCRRFFDKYSSSKQVNIDLRSVDNCGISLFAVIENVFEKGGVIHKLTFCDIFEQNLIGPFEGIAKQSDWTFSRISPLGKPNISVSSTIRDLKRAYITESENEKWKREHIKIQEISQKRIIKFLVDHLFNLTTKLNETFTDGFLSGPIKRVVFDVEVGAVIAGQIDYGRFWFFAFCPIESKVRVSDSMILDKVVKHFQDAVTKR